MDVSIQKSRKSTRLNNIYYFRQPLPHPREYMKQLNILSKKSKQKFPKCNVNSRKFQNTKKIYRNKSSQHLAMISYDHFNQLTKNSLPKKPMKHDDELMKNYDIENQNNNECYDSKNLPNVQSKIESNITSKIDVTSSTSFSTIIHSINFKENKNFSEERQVNEQEKGKCENNLENIEKEEKIDQQPIKAKKEHFYVDENKLQDFIIENKTKSHHHEQQLDIDNSNLIKERKKHLQVHHFEKISDHFNNNQELNNKEKSWWRIIMDFFSFFSGKRDYNVDNYKTNIKKFEPETIIAAKPGYPDIYNAYRLSLGPNVTPDYRHYEDLNNVISKKISKKKKKKINNNQLHEKSKMRKMSSPLC